MLLSSASALPLGAMPTADGSGPARLDQARSASIAPTSGGDVASSQSGRRIAVVVNSEAGACRSWDMAELETKLRQELAGLGTVTAFACVTGASVAQAVEAAFSDPDTDLVVVGGGDGTASTAAAAAIRTGKPVGILPLGTFNLFARLNGFPPDLDGALELLSEAEIVRIDAGRIGGRTFLHHVTIGAHPRIIRLREASDYKGRWSKKLASLRAGLSAMFDQPRLRLSIATDRETLEGRFASVAVTVNELAEVPAVAPVAADPQGGRLALYATRARSASDLLVFTVWALAGRWRSNPRASFAQVRRVEIRTPRPVLQLSIDGEAVDMAGPLDITVEPGVLGVLRVPAATAG